VADWLPLLLIVAALAGVGMLIAGARGEHRQARNRVQHCPICQTVSDANGSPSASPLPPSPASTRSLPSGRPTDPT
jgi:hypothetical protein